MDGILRHACCLFALVVLGLAAATPLRAETLTVELPSGDAAHAEYHTGESERPAVLVLHGFLTTPQFLTVRTIIDDLAVQGYTVLAPTLSLGIARRKASLECDAVHTHSMADDLAEVAFWVDWLRQRHDGRIVLVGHSTGSLHAVAHVAEQSDTPVDRVVATSLIYFDAFNPDAVVDRQVRTAREARARSDTELHRYALSYCKDNFVTPPSIYLSYLAWDRQRVLEAVSASTVPIVAIMGGKDHRFGSDWIRDLKRSGATVEVIPGANHFFDRAHEFDLLDALGRHLGS